MNEQILEATENLGNEPEPHEKGEWFFKRALEIDGYLCKLAEDCEQTCGFDPKQLLAIQKARIKLVEAVAQALK